MTGRIVKSSPVFILCLMAACGSKPPSQLLITDTDQANRESTRQEVRSAFLQRDFARLEAMAAQYRQAETHTPSGLPMLGRFYYSFDSLYGPKEPVESWMKAVAMTLVWANQYPESPTPHIVNAHLNVQYAWKIRGSGPARTVSK